MGVSGAGRTDTTRASSMAAAELADRRSCGRNSHRRLYSFHRTQPGPPESSRPFRARRAIGGSAVSRVRKSLAQSVFGAVRSFGRLDLLDGVVAECGRPAFLEAASGASLVLEHEVRSLGEPRPTSVDVLLDAGSKRVAVECKLTERKFGVCSRTQLRPGDPKYAEQHCDGNYRIQRGRRERCALTEIGVRYWTYLPHLFEWAADRDLRPCPFSEIYQLARNALAATVTASGFDRNSGHVLVVYDARNPDYSAGGAAQRQYESTIRDCRVPGLIRRLSWQRLAWVFTGAPEFGYLLVGLEGKYGIRPE